MSVNKFKVPVTEPVTEVIQSPKIILEKKSLSGDSGETSLCSGERLKKNNKIISAIGTVEELSALLGIIKAEHFDANSERKFDIANSTKVFFFGRLTQIQESLHDIIVSVGTSQKNSARYNSSRFLQGEQRIKDLEQQISSMKEYGTVDWPTNPKTSIIPGTSILEAQLQYSRTICRRAERQVISSQNIQIGIVPEPNVLGFLNRLGDYLLALSIHSLHLHSKEPMKRTGLKK